MGKRFTKRNSKRIWEDSEKIMNTFIFRNNGKRYSFRVKRFLNFGIAVALFPLIFVQLFYWNNILFAIGDVILFIINFYFSLEIKEVKK